MAQLPSEILTHSQKVCRMYKRLIRALEDWYYDRAEFRYNSTLARYQFDVNKNIKDMRVAKKLLQEGEKWIEDNLHHQPMKFFESPGGVAYERELVLPDVLVDYWHPDEKAMYPKYFARREQRKKEYEEWYYKAYPNAKVEKQS